jgi:hypothetical protein
MKERQFVHEKREEWAVWDRWLADRKGEDVPVLSPETLPRRFRALCLDLSLARDRRWAISVHSAGA